MKKIICVLLALSAAFSLTGCVVCETGPSTEESVQTEASILEYAPEMTVKCGSDTFTVGSGNYSWTSRGVNGEMGAVIACGSHPLDATREQEFRSVTGDKLVLSFPVEPDTITVIRWSKSDLGSTDRDGESVDISEMTISMKKGSWIYQVIASWDGDTWGGQAEYHLYLTK